MLSAHATPEDSDRMRGALFFALFPPPAIAARIAELADQLQRAHRLRGARTPADRLHCTLYPVPPQKWGWEKTVARAFDAAGRVKVEPFDVVFDHTMGFAGSAKHHFVLRGDRGLAGLVAFRRALGNALYLAELRDGAASFTPHVTLVYGADRLVTETYPVRAIHWRVDAFELVHSVPRRKHEHVGCWPLRG